MTMTMNTIILSTFCQIDAEMIQALLQNSNVPEGFNIKGFSMTIQKVNQRNSFSFLMFLPGYILLTYKLLDKGPFVVERNMI